MESLQAEGKKDDLQCGKEAQKKEHLL